MKSCLSLILLLFFFLGQIHLSLAAHYCGDQLIASEITFAPETPDCCEEETEKTVGCCEAQVTTSEADDHFSKSEIKISISPEFVLAYIFNFIVFNDLNPETGVFITTGDPLPVPDLLILQQRFLI